MTGVLIVALRASDEGVFQDKKKNQLSTISINTHLFNVDLLRIFSFLYISPLTGVTKFFI